MLLQDIVEASTRLAETSSRLAKRGIIAEVLRSAAQDGDPGDVELAALYLSGTLRQRRTGIGWRSLATLPIAAAEASGMPFTREYVTELLTGAYQKRRARTGE